MTLTPSHWPKNPWEGPINRKPVVFWTPRELRPQNEALLGNAGFTIVRTPYRTPRLFQQMKWQQPTPDEVYAMREEIMALCMEAWREIVTPGRVKIPDVVVLLTTRYMFRPMLEVILRETARQTIIVSPAGDEKFIRVVMHAGQMKYSTWIPDAVQVKERRDYLRRQAG